MRPALWRVSWLAIQVEKIMGFLVETFPAANQPRREPDGPAGGARMGPFKARQSVAAADVRLAPFIRQPALAYGLLGVLRPMLAGPFGVSALQRRAYLLRRQKVVRIPLGQQRPIKRLKQTFSQEL